MLPFEPWMRGELRAFCETHLGPDGLGGRGLVRPGRRRGACGIVSRRRAAHDLVAAVDARRPRRLARERTRRRDATLTPCRVARAPVVVLTFNEERNLAACLDERRGLGRRVFVVDSGSTDETRGDRRAHGATVVTHPFETHARQWQWALATLPIATDWVLALDADQRVTPELAATIADARRGGRRGTRRVTSGAARSFAAAGFATAATTRSTCSSCSGAIARHASTRATSSITTSRVAGATVDARGRHHRGQPQRGARSPCGPRSTTATPCSRRGRNCAAPRAARASASPALFGSPDDRDALAEARLGRLPLFVRPCVYFFYRYVLRLGFLDGKQGFVFHVLQAFWYRLLVDINIDEIRQSER